MPTRGSERIVSILLLAAMLAACGRAEGGAGAIVPAVGEDGMIDTSTLATDPPYTLCYSNASASDSWRVMMSAHVQYAVDRAIGDGVVETYRYADADNDPASQISDIEDLLSYGCDILILSPVAAAVDSAARRAMEAGVPVIALGRDLEHPRNRLAFVGVDHCLLGSMQAEWLSEQLGGEGKIVLLSDSEGDSPTEERLRCAREVFAEYPRIEELAHVYAGESSSEAANAVATWLTTFAQIDGIWSGGAGQASAAVEAYLDAGRAIPPIAGDDRQRFLRQWADYDLTAMAISSPTRQGADAVALALDVLRGRSIPERPWVAPLILTDANFDDIFNPLIPDEAWIDALPEVVCMTYPEACP
jgi:ribose transport system substrate-binding protein